MAGMSLDPRKSWRMFYPPTRMKFEFECNFDSRYTFVIKLIDLLFKMQKRNGNIMLRAYEIIIQVIQERANKKSLDYYEVVKIAYTESENMAKYFDNPQSDYLKPK
jgi:hypothetical protein